jgi:two-component system sensor histidine kinase HydH
MANGNAGKEGGPDRHSFLFTTLRKGEVVYLEICEPEYWRSRRFETILFPIIEVLLAALVLFVRGLILRNDEYRRRIEDQQNLVVLGTAASTLAHEIKNPLLSIRLQTRILEKTCPPDAMREIRIIYDEVERLSALSNRVGDYLRDPAGNPRIIDAADVALEVGMRLCGRNILKVPEEAPSVSMDPERLRSVLENLLRNALESGGPEEGVSIEVGKLDDAARIDVLDRGVGLAPEVRARLFDPFFTTKSRGTGIGLSVCQRFVLASGGSIELTNRPGGGCRARLLIPSAEAKK